MIKQLKVLVNTTTCVVGGGIQAAASFVSQAVRDNRNVDYLCAVSPQVMQNIHADERISNRLKEVHPSPARLWYRRAVRRELSKIESTYKPDVVFSIFGPAYHNFTAPHICGFADGWVTHRSSIAMSFITPLRRMHLIAKCYYKAWHLSPNDYYIVETDVARRGLVRLLGIPSTKINVIPNTYSDVFEKPLTEKSKEYINTNVRVLCLAAPYPHKNIAIIPEVASMLREKDTDRVYTFIVTLPDEGTVVEQFWAKSDKYGVKDMIENAGILKLQDCPRFYASSDIVFLPTLLETFSATYPEAMVMGKPIVTTDLDFAHDICGDAANYYAPLSARAAADAIKKVAEDKDFHDSLIRNGYQRLKLFPTPEEKYRLTVKWIKEVAEMGKH